MSRLLRVAAGALRALALAAAAASPRPALAGDAHEAAPLGLEPPPPSAHRVQFVVRFPAWRFTGTYRATCEDAGLLAGEGTARDAGGLGTPGAIVERTLRSEGGTLVIRLAGEHEPRSVPAFAGRWSIASGTGQYAGLRGGGTFSSTDSGVGEKGSPFELQILVGRVWRAPPGHEGAARSSSR